MQVMSPKQVVSALGLLTSQAMLNGGLLTRKRVMV